MFPGRPGLPISSVKYSLNVSADEFAIHRTGRFLCFDSSYYEIVSAWSANLTLQDWGRVARHPGIKGRNEVNESYAMRVFLKNATTSSLNSR